MRRKEHKIPHIRWPIRIFMYSLSIILSILTILQSIYNFINIVVAGIFYGITAVFLCISIYYLVRDIIYIKTFYIKALFKKNKFINKLILDYHYRTVNFAFLSFTINFVFAIINGYYAFKYQSWWFLTFSIYYVVLVLMRFIALRAVQINSRIEEIKIIKQNERRIYRICGILFICLTIVTSESVVLIIMNNGGKTYAGNFILVVAIYTFYKIIIAILNLSKVRKIQAPIISTIRYIGYADAVISVLLLQTAMFASFGGKEIANENLMNGMTGAVVCLMVLIMGIGMIYRSKKGK